MNFNKLGKHYITPAMQAPKIKKTALRKASLEFLENALAEFRNMEKQSNCVRLQNLTGTD